MKRLPLFVLLSTALFSCSQPRVPTVSSDENAMPLIEGLSDGPANTGHIGTWHETS